VQIGMGEGVLITTFVVIVVGGIGSVRGAFAGAVLIGMSDTLGRAYVPMLLKTWFSGPMADGFGAALASIIIYLVMAMVLVARPRGLFPVGS
jgi:branched-chain amino acid transport system permease protein